MGALDRLDQAAATYAATKEAHDQAARDTLAAVVAALREGHSPTEVTKRSPFSAAYVRRVARENGIEPAAPGPKRRAAT